VHATTATRLPLRANPHVAARAQPGALGPDDAEDVSDDLPANSSTLLIAFEHLWAAKLVDALHAADAVVIDSIRIPADVVEAALKTV
jgi:Family of unknown function (DUF6325)